MDGFPPAATANTLLDVGASVLTQDEDGCNALHLAVRSAAAEFDVVKQIATSVNDQGAINATDKYGQTALICALDHPEISQLEVLNMLLLLGAAVNLR